MKRVFQLRRWWIAGLVLLATLLPVVAFAAPVSFDWGSFSSTGLTTYGVYNTDNTTILQTGNFVQLIWAGTDGLIAPPKCDGAPSGDDQLLGTNTIQNTGSLPPPALNKGYLPLKTYSFDTTDAKSGGVVYIRAWNAATPSAATAYGNSATGTLTGGDTFNTLRWHTDQAWPMPTTWVGPTDGAWNMAANWSAGCVPTSRTPVTIPTGAAVVLTGDGAAKSLTVANGGTLDLATYQLTVENAVTNDGALRQRQTIDATCTTAAPCQLLYIRNAAGTTIRYYGLELAPTGGDKNLGLTIAQIKGNQACGITEWDTTTARRCYDINPATHLATAVRFYFSNTDLQPGQDPSNLQIWRFDGYDWLQVTRTADSGSACTGDDCWVEGTSDTLGTFVLDHLSPTAVTLTGLSALQVSDAIVVTWETTSEVRNLGFNLWRGISSVTPDSKLNDALIAAQTPGSPEGSDYTWEDRNNLVSGTTYWYWLEDLDTNGLLTRHAPVSIQYNTPNTVTLRELHAGPAGGRALAGLAALALAALIGVVLRR